MVSKTRIRDVGDCNPRSCTSKTTRAFQPRIFRTYLDLVVLEPKAVVQVERGVQEGALSVASIALGCQNVGVGIDVLISARLAELSGNSRGREEGENCGDLHGEIWEMMTRVFCLIDLKI